MQYLLFKKQNKTKQNKTKQNRQKQNQENMKKLYSLHRIHLSRTLLLWLLRDSTKRSPLPVLFHHSLK